MPDTARARTGLQASKGSTDTVDTIDNTMAAAFDKLETDMAIDGQGAFSARPTSTVGTPGKRGRYYRDEFGRVHRDFGTGWETYQPVVPLVTALPTGTGIPYDGQEIYLQTSAMVALGVVWQLRYNASSSSSYKWEFVGGSELLTESTVQEGQSPNSPAYSVLANPASITLPLAGDYMVGLTGEAQVQATAPAQFELGVAIGAVTTPNSSVLVDLSSTRVQSLAGLKRMNGLTANVVLSILWRASLNNVYINSRRLTARPVRVG